MTEETLDKANRIKKNIDRLDIEQIKISNFYSRKESLTKEEIDELFQIAMVNTKYTLNIFKEELKAL